MAETYKNCVIIVAAGRGSRMQTASETAPKQYIKLNDRPVLYHCLSAFNACDEIDAILTVIHPDDSDLYEASVPSGVDKLLAPITGGETRQHSVLNGLIALKQFKPEYVYIHDAARPFISPDIVSEIRKALDLSDGALPALPIADTVKIADRARVINTVPREGLWRAQTPQAFAYDQILEAHTAALEQIDKVQFTDDASIAEWYGLTVDLIHGHEELRKLTTSEDLEWARNHLEVKNMAKIPQGSYRTGVGFDVHAFEEGDYVILCGVSVPHNKALKGHSDADVAMHTLTDALYGSIADGDIGIHFPPSDPQWKGAASHIFLEHAVKRIKERNGIIQNVDLTIMCESPRIGPHSHSMREKLSEIMDLSVDRISVKATTTEKLGFTGREEGIACMATATVWLSE